MYDEETVPKLIYNICAKTVNNPNCHSLGLLWLPWALLSLYPVQKTKTKQEQQLKVILLTIAKLHLEDYILGRFFFITSHWLECYFTYLWSWGTGITWQALVEHTKRPLAPFHLQKIKKMPTEGKCSLPSVKHLPLVLSILCYQAIRGSPEAPGKI